MNVYIVSNSWARENDCLKWKESVTKRQWIFIWNESLAKRQWIFIWNESLAIRDNEWVKWKES